MNSNPEVPEAFLAWWQARFSQNVCPLNQIKDIEVAAIYRAASADFEAFALQRAALEAGAKRLAVLLAEEEKENERLDLAVAGIEGHYAVLRREFEASQARVKELESALESHAAGCAVAARELCQRVLGASEPGRD